MEIQEIMTAISTVGFPIVACAAMFWNNRENQRLHREESDKWSEALLNNTLAIQKLTDMLDKEE